MRALLLLLFVPRLALAAEPVRLAAPELSVIDISAERGSFYTEHLASRLNEAGVQVTTSKAIAQLLGAERQRQLLGCSDGTSCVAEIAAALGTDGVVFGEIARIDTGFQVNLKVVSAQDARQYSSFQGRAASETGLLEQLDLAAAQLAAETAGALGRKLEPISHASTFPFRPVAVGLGAGGVVAVAVGTVFLVLARQTADQFPTGMEAPISRDRADGLVSTGKSYQSIGFVCVGVGAALVAAGVGTFVAGSASTRVALVPTPGGAAFALAGEF